MDTFFEQIVPKKTGIKEKSLLVLIWILACLISFVLLVVVGRLLAFGILLAALAFYGAYRLSQRFFIEFEYIVTNNTLDIDKIIAKSSRKRICSVEIPNVTEIKKLNGILPPLTNGETRVVSCDTDNKDAYILTVSGDNKRTTIIMAPNDRIKEGIVKSLPKYVANSAFKGE